MEPPRVVRIRRSGGKIIVDCDIYIGQPCRIGGWNLDYNKWSSPYNLSAFGKDRCDPEDHYRLNQAYEDYVRSSPELMKSLQKVNGKTLGCWCKPEACHGDVLVKLLQESKS